TSNLGSEVFNGAGEHADKTEAVLQALRRHFRPEFLNRVDDIVVFHSLSREDIRRIVDVQIKRLSKRLEEKHIAIELSDAARDYLADEGFDPAYGARPLKRAIQRLVLDPMAMEILSGAIQEGSRVFVDLEDGRLRFRPLANAVP
ncbi:MAG TPA: hypothetical protein PKO36_06970, partial [Candidatus Hydrogenedentes bacterium]|nr:hypothetical protein [Candidatus Hydrogenedentota bacterium]